MRLIFLFFCSSLVMHYADAGDLLQKINERKARKVFFRESQVWRVLIETVHGLQALHEMGIMHRDIKSANIFLCKPRSGGNNAPNLASRNDTRSVISQSQMSQDSTMNEKGTFLF